jgi:hypothetical protein
VNAEKSGKSPEYIQNVLIPAFNSKFPVNSVPGKKVDVSNVTAMVIDNGFFVDMARTLGKAYKKVYYCVPSWVSPAPIVTMAHIGFGYPEIQIVPSIYFIPPEDIDIYIFLDCGFADTQLHLESLGKRVWGARKGEELEFSRLKTKDILKAAGLPVGKYEVITGTTNLRKYLKENKDQVVKVEVWRGIMETFKSKTYDISEYQIDELDTKLGAFKNIQKFIVEQALNDKVESGFDGWSIDGEFPTHCICGIEIKDLGYVGQYCEYKDMPQPLIDVNNALAPVMKKEKYRSMFSTEVRIGKDHKPYLVDITSRNPVPPGETYQRLYTNLAEIIYEGANGVMVEPKVSGKWVCELILQSEWMKHWQPVKIPKEFEDNVFLKNSCIIDGKHYVMPVDGESDELAQIGSVVGIGNTMEEAIEKADKAGKSLEGIFLSCPSGAAQKAKEEIEKLKSNGVWVK